MDGPTGRGGVVDGWCGLQVRWGKLHGEGEEEEG